MILNGINFPNQIVDAINDNKLVVFAGAGASVDAPTSLPNFEKLTIEIAEGTGRVHKPGTACEAFLGSLKAQNGVDVNQQAADITSKACLEPNKTHEAIIELFSSPDSIKIVTTNYDQMFERVLESKGICTTVYNVPAIPLGDDISGIIHIHGNVDNPKYMVVTDEDFGRAYLTDGYAARFLVKLFESYTVLFIGYSYADTILRYLTRAMSRHKTLKRYILTDDKKSDWDVLGMTPILYSKGKHAVMRDALIKLGNRSKKGLMEWKDQFIDFNNSPPKDLTMESEIDYCLESTEKSQLLAHYVRGREWLDVLERKGVFGGCFSQGEISEKDKIWADWLCDAFIGVDDEGFNRLILKHGNIINEYMAHQIIWKLFNSEISDDTFKLYVMMLDDSITDSRYLLHLVENAEERKLYSLSFYLFRKFYKITLKVVKQMSYYSDKIRLSHSFFGDYYQIQRSWEKINKSVISVNAFEVLTFVKEKIEELCIKYETVGQDSDGREFGEFSMLEAEGDEKRLQDDPLYLLSDIFIDAVLALQEQNKQILKDYLSLCISSKSLLLKRISLKAIRKSKAYSSSEKLKIVIGENLIWNSDCKQQVFLLVADIFNELNKREKDSLLDIIESGNDPDKLSNAYEIYNWCVWLHKMDQTNERINNLIQRMTTAYSYFTPREHPELDFFISSGRVIIEQSPVSEAELFDMPMKNVAIYLRDFNTEQFDGPSRWGLLDVFGKCVKGKYTWADEVLHALVEEEINKEDIWEQYLQNIREADYSFEQKLSIYEQVVQNIDIVLERRTIASCLLDIVRDEKFKKDIQVNEDRLLAITDILWKHRKSDIEREGTILYSALNTTTGTILLSWVQMLSYSGRKYLPEKYKGYFEEALSLHTWELVVAICILAGHYYFFYFLDQSWCTEQFNSMLEGSSKKRYAAAWEGITYFSARIFKDTADAMAPIYLKATYHIDWLSEDVKRRFIELLLTLMLYVINKPTLKYIPVFYRSSKSKDHVLLIKSIKQRLRNMDKESKINWWNSWLKHFLDNRKKNKPIELSDDENREILDLLLELEDVFDDAVDIVCTGKIPDGVDMFFWYSLKDTQLPEMFPHSMARLLIKLLKVSTNIGSSRDIIVDIVNRMEGLEEKETKQLQELMLKNSIVL